jgi:hypothetical protein
LNGSLITNSLIKDFATIKKVYRKLLSGKKDARLELPGANTTIIKHTIKNRKEHNSFLLKSFAKNSLKLYPCFLPCKKNTVQKTTP